MEEEEERPLENRLGLVTNEPASSRVERRELRLPSLVSQQRDDDDDDDDDEAALHMPPPHSTIANGRRENLTHNRGRTHSLKSMLFNQITHKRQTTSETRNKRQAHSSAAPSRHDHIHHHRRHFPRAPSTRRKCSRSLQRLLDCAAVHALACLLAIAGALLAVGANGEPSKQTIAVHPEPKYFVPAGQQVKLPCHVANRQGDCAWLGTGGKIVSPSGKKYIFARSPADGDCSILIRNASVLADDGEWQCQALTPDPETDTLQQSRSTQLVVLVAPERPQIRDLVSSCCCCCCCCFSCLP